MTLGIASHSDFASTWKSQRNRSFFAILSISLVTRFVCNSYQCDHNVMMELDMKNLAFRKSAESVYPDAAVLGVGSGRS